jgi:curved DNA-binding protein CbpA
MKNYYRTLGVLDDAEDIIIRAAYKALAQRYHPDKWKGDPREANKRMSDINEAYDVLSDITKRKKYDEEYFRNRARDESTEEDESDANFISEEDEAWQLANEFFPQINKEYDELKKISPIVANTFKATLIQRQVFKNSNALKITLENDYLSRYYGQDKDIQKFVKQLLLSGEKKAAIRINKIVRLLGPSVTYEQILQKIQNEFNYVNQKDRTPTLDIVEITKLTKQIEPYVKKLKDVGYELTESNFEISNIFWKFTYLKNGQFCIFKSPSEIKDFTNNF